MGEIATQWPLLAGFMTLYGSSLLIIRSLYERIISDQREDLKEARQLGKDATAVTEKLADRLDAVLAAYQRERRE